MKQPLITRFEVVVIVGPTAVGKTKLSIELARNFNGEIISGDAMQIYRGLDIGTAKITNAEMAGISHHLLDAKNPDERYSVAEYQKTVRNKIAEIAKRGKLPIIVGGTGLYIKAVLYDYQFSDQDHTTEAQYEKLTNEEVHALLVNIDPESAKILHPNNRRRVVRALSIYEQTQQTKSQTLKKQEKKLLYNATLIGLTAERNQLYERINTRVDNMITSGLIAEVGALYEAKIPKEAQAIAAIGYKELYDYFAGITDLPAAVALIKRNSRRLAKRQYTWFNNQMPVTWFDADVDNFEVTTAKVSNYLLK